MRTRAFENSISTWNKIINDIRLHLPILYILSQNVHIVHLLIKKNYVRIGIYENKYHLFLNKDNDSAITAFV